jgi:sRNA-binding protein
MERNRGLKESREQIKVLQDKWPAAFPKQASLVRPLANGTAKTIAEAFGWRTRARC